MKAQPLALAGLTLLLGHAAFAVCPSPTVSTASLNPGETACSLRGEILDKVVTLTADNVYVLEGAVYVGGDNTHRSELHIAPGTKIVGKSGTDFLVIRRGSQIFAEGAKDPGKQIVFTSSRPEGRRRSGDWGGLVLNGNAPINTCQGSVCEAEFEGIPGSFYGGGNPNDNSGVLKYVRVEFAGHEVAPDKELNGVTFNGVGRGTVVDFLQVHKGSDDGVEFFGGTVDIKHIVLTGNEDDAFDWDQGYSGRAQFGLVQQIGDVNDNGFEADNNVNQHNAQPRSNPTISNFTLIGNAKGSYGALLRRGTAANISNTIMTGWAKAGIDIDDDSTFNNGGVAQGGAVEATNLKFHHSILFNARNYENDERKKDGSPQPEPWVIEPWFVGQPGNLTVDPQLAGWYPTATSPALGAGAAPEDGWFDFVDYIGAFSAVDDDWATGWITLAPN